MSEYNSETSSRNIDNSDESEGEEFVPRFVKIFNESKSYDNRRKETVTTGRDSYQEKESNKFLMPPSEAKVRASNLQNPPFRQQRKSWSEGTCSEGIEEISMDRPSLRKQASMTHKHDLRKTIVRTNTDSEILIPKEREDSFETPLLQEMPGQSEISIRELKERLQQGRLPNYFQGRV